MERVFYKDLPKDEQVKIVASVLGGKSIREVSKGTGVPRASIQRMIGNADINPDKEYALQYRKEHPWMGTKQKDDINSFNTDIPESTTNNPEELKKENRDLRKKIAYLEDKITYLRTLYEIISTSPSEVSKKKDSKQS